MKRLSRHGHAHGYCGRPTGDGKGLKNYACGWKAAGGNRTYWKSRRLTASRVSVTHPESDRGTGHFAKRAIQSLACDTYPVTPS